MLVTPNLDSFRSQAERHEWVVLSTEISADLETPVSAFLKVCGARTPSFLLESVEQGEQLGRFSYLGCEPLDLLRIPAGQSAWRMLRDRMAASRMGPFPPDLPFAGGAVGYWGYETVSELEPTVGVHAAGELDLPDAVFMLTRRLMVFDHAKRTIRVLCWVHVGENHEAAYQEGSKALQEWVERLRLPLAAAPLELKPMDSTVAWESNMDPERFQALVRTAQEAIKAGDVFQLVGSQRLSAPFGGDPFDLYRVLRTINPSPYMFFLNWGDFQLVGSSPEVMVRLDDRLATVRPIAGTRRRGLMPDDALGADLQADPKERAEHVMLVDLGRNDLGRVCKPGTVKVKDLMTLERFSHVVHMTSTVTGQLKDGLDGLDLLAACFPAGTVTGAPKIRAMQLIRELEPDRRGPYAGAVGVLGFDGSINTGITIRTMVVRNSRVYVQAGAGIVADSDPSCEYQETLNKAQASLQALQLAPASSQQGVNRV